MSIQPVPINPLPLPAPAAANAPTTSTLSSSDALSALLSMSPEEISRRGIPEPLFSAWVKEFRSGLQDGTLILCLTPETAWTINSQMGLFLHQQLNTDSRYRTREK